MTSEWTVNSCVGALKVSEEFAQILTIEPHTLRTLLVHDMRPSMHGQNTSGSSTAGSKLQLCFERKI